MHGFLHDLRIFGFSLHKCTKDLNGTLLTTFHGFPVLDFDRLPFWPSMKLIFICWLVLPYFNGAAYVYQNYVRPAFINNQMVNIWYVPQKKGLFGKSDDFLTTLDKFVEENGTEALKKLANKVQTPYYIYVSHLVHYPLLQIKFDTVVQACSFWFQLVMIIITHHYAYVDSILILTFTLSYKAKGLMVILSAQRFPKKKS